MSLSETLSITSLDGVTSEATLFVDGSSPGADPPGLVVVCLPAMGVPARYYHALARALARPGIAVVTAEHRGIGSSSVRASRTVDFGYLERLRDDLPPLLAEIGRKLPDARLVLFGHSLGAHLSAMHASTAKEPPAALVFVAAGTSYHRNWPWPHNLKLLTAATLVRSASAVLGYFPGRTFGFFGREARRQVLEWADLTTTGRFLEVILGRLEIPYDAVAEQVERASRAATISSTCTVFAESEVISLVAQGEPIECILRGLHQSLAARVASLAGAVPEGVELFMSGGVAQNAAMVSSLGARIGRPVTVLPAPQLIGALGAALIVGTPS